MPAVDVPLEGQLLDGGRAGVAGSGKVGSSGREEQMRAQVEELTTALVEAHVKLRCEGVCGARLYQLGWHLASTCNASTLS